MCSSMGKIILFYKYVTLENPKKVLDWQKTICTSLGLKGRIILAHEGINATLGGESIAIDEYVTAMKQDPLFADIDFKESIGSANCFPRLAIKIKEEIVKMGVSPKELSAQDGGIHLSPQQVHDLLQNKPENLVILDTRNKFESHIGTFKDAIKADINYFREFPGYIDSSLDQFKDKEVLMFCTGGVRCERATGYLKKKGVAKQVYQLEGGIHRYIEQFPDGFFRGKNYVFDARISVSANDDVLAICPFCKNPWDEYINCLNALCNKHILCCPLCIDQLSNTCSPECKDLLEQNKVPSRPAFKKVSIDNTRPK